MLIVVESIRHASGFFFIYEPIFIILTYVMHIYKWCSYKIFWAIGWKLFFHFIGEKTKNNKKSFSIYFIFWVIEMKLSTNKVYYNINKLYRLLCFPFSLYILNFSFFKHLALSVQKFLISRRKHLIYNKSASFYSF